MLLSSPHVHSPAPLGYGGWFGVFPRLLHLSTSVPEALPKKLEESHVFFCVL